MSSPRNPENNAAAPKRDEGSLERLLRPASFEDYIGQPTVKTNLATMIEAAKKRGEAIDHLLFYGQAGLGKTTLATIVAKEMDAYLKVTSGPAIEKASDLATILSTLEEGDVLFIDEIHRLNHLIEEMLYPAMESRVLHLVIGKGPAARMVSIDLPPFTLIAATTRANLLSSPLRSRFGATFRIDYYALEDIQKIIERSAKLLGMRMEPRAVELVAQASRCTPRIANRLLRRVRDVAQVMGRSEVDGDVAVKALTMFEIDQQGLEDHDRRLLRVIIEKFKGGPVGLSTLAAALGEDRGTIEDVYEPYLLKMGFLMRTTSGRVATDAAYRHLGIEKE
jgi:Holliday junction DNA helicase RuvB